MSSRAGGWSSGPPSEPLESILRDLMLPKERYAKGEAALKRAEELLTGWGFSLTRTGCEFQLTQEELLELRGDPDELTDEQRALRFAPDLKIEAFVEAKHVKSLDELSWSVREWLEHRQRGGTIYMFCSPDGSYKMIPVDKLKPEKIFYVHDADRDWLEREFPSGAEIIQLDHCSGSGEPFAVMRT